MGFIVSMAAGLGVVLCAETLILLGNGVGRGGAWLLVFIVAGVGLHLLGAFTHYVDFSGPRDETRLLQRTLGGTASVVFPLAGRAAVAVVASTGLLATAGFVFNEVFVYWFPNFLFAFLLLGMILAVNLAGRRVWGGFQVLAVLAALTGLAVLIVAGLGWTPTPNPASAPAPAASLPRAADTGSWLRLALLAVLIPVGYDLAFLADGAGFGQHRRSPAAAVLLGSFALVLWGFVSLRWVDAARLAETTIPYTVAARAILGQEGRIIMGIVIISGAAGAINSLFGGISRMMAGMSEAGLAPAFLGKPRFGERVPVLLLGAATTAMLLSGMAGSDHLDGFLRGGLVLWLIHYAVLHLAAFLSGRHDDSRPVRRMAHLLGALILALAALGLWVLDEERQVMAVFMFIVVGAVLILGLLWTGLARNWDQGR